MLKKEAKHFGNKFSHYFSKEIVIHKAIFIISDANMNVEYLKNVLTVILNGIFSRLSNLLLIIY